MNIEKLNITRVWIDENFYIDITPYEDFFEFWLYNKNIGSALYMFCTACNSDIDAVELAIANADKNIELYNQEYINV